MAKSTPKNNAKTKQKPLITRNLQDLSTLLAQVDTAEETENETLKPTPQEKKIAFNEHRNSTYNVVSLVAYLIGIDKEHFGNGDAPFLLTAYDKYEQDKGARIIRNLSRIRTAMERNYMAIVTAFRQDIKNIGSVPDLIPTESVTKLETDGVRLYKTKPDIDEYLIAINVEINNRINAVAPLFPEWVKWDYVKPLFIMPGGTKKDGIKKAGEYFNADRRRYPFQTWINWDAISHSAANHGNILYDDEKFLVLLYERNEDRFENLSLVRDVGNHTMRNLTALLERSKKCVIVVDCENSDAVKLAAALSSLPAVQVNKVSKVLLFDSEYTTDQWKTLVDRSLRMAIAGGNAPELEHIVVPRLNQNKSQVDMTLAVRTSREVYTGGVDAVILVSSDSDYWALIQQLEGTKFLVLLEKRKTGLAIMDTLSVHDIPFCFIDDFCTSASYGIKTGTLINSIQTQIDAVLSGQASGPINVKKMLDDALRDSWITMTEKEKAAFYSRYLQHMRMNIAADGELQIIIDA